MNMLLPLLDTSREMLKHGIFNHFSDSEISNLHNLMYHLQQTTPFSKKDEMNLLVDCWYRGNYFESTVPFGLLQKVNLQLQQLGKPAIDIYALEMTEENY